MQLDPHTLGSLAVELGVSMETSGPSPGITPAEGRDSKAWPHISYTVTLTRNGKTIWKGPYKLGIGHVDPKKCNADSILYFRLTTDESCLLEHWKSKLLANFKDKNLHATVAAKLAKAQRVFPKLEDVLHSLIMDGQPYFDALSFEEWANEYGYDFDSRTVEKTFQLCDEIGRKLARAFTSKEIAKLREAANNH